MAVPITPAQGQAIGPFIGIGVAAVILILRNARARALKIERLWIRPVIFLALLGALLYAAPPPLTFGAIGVLVLSLLLGCGFGWQRGRFTRIDIHPETHEITSQQSVWGLVFIFALLIGRYLLRSVLAENARVIGVPALVIGDAFLVFAVGMMVTQGIEVWLRASRMLGEARAKTGSH